MSRALEIAHRLLKKEAWAGKAISKTFGGLNRVGTALSNQLAEAGVQSETAHALAKIAPHVAAAYGAKKGWESEPVQRIRAKIRSMRGQDQGEGEYQ